MSNRRLGVTSASKKSEKKSSSDSDQRLTTYNQPTKGVKFNQYERELVEKSISTLRDATGDNVTFSKVIRSLSYMLEEKDVISKLGVILKDRIQ